MARYFVLEFSVLYPRYFAGDWMMWVSQDTLEYFHAVRFDDTVNAVYVVFRLCLFARYVNYAHNSTFEAMDFVADFW